VPGEVTRAIFGYVTWLVIAAVLFLRAAAGWRGRRAAYGTLTGFGLAVVVLLLYLLRTPVPPPTTVTAATIQVGVSVPIPVP
jgi:ABC-type transport system involved in cytochrome c biogenesis permease subunit